LLQFPGRFAIRIVKRFFYLYLLRDFNMGSIETLAGLPLVLFGIIFGIWHWVRSVTTGQLASTGTVMLAVLPLVVGVQLLLAALGVDIANRPETPLQRRFGIAKVAIPSSVQRRDLP
jgi:dolichol-phosphate mannosyltransferase